METIKKYKTISMLIFLIIVFGILAVFVKLMDIGGIKTASNVQSSISVTPTPIQDPFIHPETFNIPSSYMGYVVAKMAQADLGKAILKYGNKAVDLAGSEWVISKSKVSDFEYGQIKPYLNSYVQQQLGNKGWAPTASVSASGTQSAQLLSPNLPKGDLSQGYIQVEGGKVQEVVLSGGKDSLGNVEFKLFLSNIYNTKDLRPTF
jgi:hypothetical protein